MKTQALSIRLTPEELEHVDALCGERNRSEVIRAFIKQGLAVEKVQRDVSHTREQVDWLVEALQNRPEPAGQALKSSGEAPDPTGSDEPGKLPSDIAAMDRETAQQAAAYWHQEAERVRTERMAELAAEAGEPIELGEETPFVCEGKTYTIKRMANLLREFENVARHCGIVVSGTFDKHTPLHRLGITFNENPFLSKNIVTHSHQGWFQPRVAEECQLVHREQGYSSNLRYYGPLTSPSGGSAKSLAEFIYRNCSKDVVRGHDVYVSGASEEVAAELRKIEEVVNRGEVEEVGGKSVKPIHFSFVEVIRS